MVSLASKRVSGGVSVGAPDYRALAENADVYVERGGIHEWPEDAHGIIRDLAAALRAAAQEREALEQLTASWLRDAAQLASSGDGASVVAANGRAACALDLRAALTPTGGK